MPTNEDEDATLWESFFNSPDIQLIAPAKGDVPGVEFLFDDSGRECRIWEGYLHGSAILLREALKREPQDSNLVFPALFNLHHAMEVALKWHIRYAGGVVPPHAGHNLNILIRAFRQTADDLDDEASYISDYMLNCISELALIDPRSVAFRYSTELDGSPITITPKRWDLRRLCFTVDMLSILFDGLSGWIDLSRDEEYQAYLRDGCMTSPTSNQSPE